MHDPGPPPSQTPGTAEGPSNRNGGNRFNYKWLTWLFNFYTWVRANVGTDFFFEVSAGNKVGFAHINKFGRNTDIDTTQEDVWDGGGTITYSTTADITHIVSSNAGDTFDIEIQGLDADWNLVTQSKALTGTTGVALDTPLIRVFRMKNDSGTAAAGNIQCGVGAVTTSFTAGNLRGQITLGFEQTLMALYTVPANKTAYLVKYWGDVNKSNVTGALDLTLWARSFGGVFRVQSTNGLIAAGSSSFERDYKPYPSYSEKTDLRVTGTGSTNNFDVSAGFDLILVDN